MIHGMLSVKKLKKLVKAEKIETVVMGFTDHIGRMMGKRYDAEFFIEEGLSHGTHACNYLLTVDMEMEPTPGYDFANWALGYGDFHLVPDLATMRIASWLEKSVMVLCDIYDSQTGELVTVAPRSMLRKQLISAEKLNYSAMAASELEYYIFEDTYKEAAQKKYADLEPAGWYSEDYHIFQGTRVEKFNAAARRHLKKSGVPVENSKGEFGMGQHELNVRYSDALNMADRHTVFKQCMKEVAEQVGVSVTFMAKPHSGQAGNSCHIHFSLWRDGENIFAGDDQLGPVACSQEFRWFLGGWMKHAADMMVFYAPTINAYKRFEDGSWAPTRIAWCHDNRTAGFRIVGSGKSLRIECRIPGADCNPYLVFAAVLASGLDGIANQTEPPAQFIGDVYAAQHLPRVPYTLHEATDLFANSDFAKQAFGADVVKHYTHFFRTEQAAYNTFVTDWERQRYFERI